jgi:NAD(P)-dependent dehydrogenase (short-subunit alcohol dehydrogenase family)
VALRIVLTGASRGLGRAMLEGFAARGHTVIGCGTNAELVEELRQKWGAPHQFQVVDVRNDSEVRRWAEASLTAGPPDLLVNNAAVINPNSPLWEVSAESFDRVIDVNIKGVANVIRHFVPAMIARRRGVIVNFSSGWGRSVSPEVAPYCATKWAIEGLTQALAEELPSGMAAIPLNPGIINTDMLQSGFGAAANSYPAPEEWAKRAVPFILKLSATDNGQPLSVPGG